MRTERENGMRKGVKSRVDLMGRERFICAGVICSGERSLTVTRAVGQLCFLLETGLEEEQFQFEKE